MNKIVFPNGQTCNKFFSLLAPLAYAIENKCQISVLLPDKALADYPNLTNNKYLRFPLWKPRLAKFVGYKSYEDWTRRFFSYFFKKNPLIPTSFKKKMIWDSWNNRDFIVDESFLPIVREIFLPKGNIRQAVIREFDAIRNADRQTIIIGCHFRRGDYKDWKGGQFYFSNADWKRFMSALALSFPDKNIKYFVATNEKFSQNDFADLDIFTLKSVASAAADLFALSLCDYIIGPPSTFSNWAALVGQKPLCHIADKSNFNPHFAIPSSNIGIVEA